MVERTFALIKPDAVKAKNIGKIIDMIEQNGFEIVKMHKIHMSEDQAKAFYAVHKEKPFFQEMIDFVISGPVIAMMLEKENAITDWRDLMGALKDPKEGTIRKSFGTDIMLNAVHGSDAPETAKTELALFFPCC